MRVFIDHYEAQEAADSYCERMGLDLDYIDRCDGGRSEWIHFVDCDGKPHRTTYNNEFGE